VLSLVVTPTPTTSEGNAIIGMGESDDTAEMESDKSRRKNGICSIRFGRVILLVLDDADENNEGRNKEINCNFVFCNTDLIVILLSFFLL
jgi:hypothetical protein